MDRHDFNISIVLTTINSPTYAVTEISRQAADASWDFIIVGDEKSPVEYSIPHGEFFDLTSQRNRNLNFANLCPQNHYARKNIGYLIALSRNSTHIVETDDDNIPYSTFTNISTPANPTILISLERPAWFNIYSLFTFEKIWPRGFPLEYVSTTGPAFTQTATPLSCPIRQGLADLNPDVDAVFRMIFPERLGHIKFDTGKRFALNKGAWCPFNSQNTIWETSVAPLLYLPVCCSFRMTDIWRSFVAQRILWESSRYVEFFSPTVYQERNAHSLQKDFVDEVPGFLGNEQIVTILEGTNLLGGSANLLADVRRCYDQLIKSKLLPTEELKYLDAWTADIEAIVT